MFKRFFWLLFGFALGIGSSWAVNRRLRRLAERYAPADVVYRWSETLRSDVIEGRTAMRTREHELNSSFERAAGH